MKSHLTQSAEIDHLLARIREADRSGDSTWTAALTSRKRDELDYHDFSHAPHEIESRETGRSNKKLYTTAGRSTQYRSDWIRQHVGGRVFLDYACGIGSQVIEAAQAGAALAVGLDISPVSIEGARKAAADAGVADRTVFLQADCENTGLPDDSFDVVLCSGMFHHVDLSFALPELRRIMKPGGVLLGVEALRYNPFIRLYRRATPHLRTSWERRHIMSLSDLRFAGRFFGVRDVRYWHLFCVLVTPLRKTSLFGPALRITNAVDRVVLRIFPFRLLAWQFSFELVKEPRSP